MFVRQLNLPVTVRDLEPQDLDDLAWSGSPEHLDEIDEALQASYLDLVELVVIGLPNAQLIAVGGVDFRKGPDFGELWMLSVHPAWQSLGIGTMLIGALELKINQRGLARARLGVEYDNPRAAALYHRLGYREVGSSLDSWPAGDGRTYVTVCAVMDKEFEPADDPR